MTSNVFGPADDDFHDVGDRWWATETCWFSFSHPNRKIGGWLYSLWRPNIGTCQGGAWVWDDTAWAPWEVLYHANYSSLRLPEERDLRSFVFPTGVAVRCIEPLSVYELRYEDGDRIKLALRFEAVIEPQPFAHGEPPFLSASHFDQLGRLTGELVLHGEHLEIDCLSVRDRSWGPRPETRPRRLSYNFGTTSPTSGFFAVTNPSGSSDVVNHGWLLHDGVVNAVIDGSRRVERDPLHGWITREVIEGRDTEGRTFRADGESVSRIVLNRHTAITWTSLMRWEFGGGIAWGEDQDMWPVHDWSAFRRTALSSRSLSHTSLSHTPNRGHHS